MADGTPKKSPHPSEQGRGEDGFVNELAAEKWAAKRRQQTRARDLNDSTG
jgi:hypothetical protein